MENLAVQEKVEKVLRRQGYFLLKKTGAGEELSREIMRLEELGIVKYTGVHAGDYIYSLVKGIQMTTFCKPIEAKKIKRINTLVVVHDFLAEFRKGIIEVYEKNVDVIGEVDDVKTIYRARNLKELLTFKRSKKMIRVHLTNGKVIDYNPNDIVYITTWSC